MCIAAVLHCGNFPVALFLHTILPVGNCDLSALTVQIIFTQLYLPRTWCVWPYLLGTCTARLWTVLSSPLGYSTHLCNIATSPVALRRQVGLVLVSSARQQ